MNQRVFHHRLKNKLHHSKLFHLIRNINVKTAIVLIPVIVNVYKVTDIVQLVLQCHQAVIPAHAVIQHAGQGVDAFHDIMSAAYHSHPTDCRQGIKQKMRIQLRPQRFIAVLLFDLVFLLQAGEQLLDVAIQTAECLV